MEAAPTNEKEYGGGAGAGDVVEVIDSGGGEGWVDEEEKRRVEAMRGILEKQDPSAKEVDDLTIRRFLRARDLDVEKGSALLLQCLSWRRSFVPNSCISPSEIPNQLADKKLFMQGHDKLGRPVIVGFAGRHRPSKGVEELKRFVVYTLDKICARIPSGQEKFVAIVDLEGWGYSSCDIRGYLAALSILQDYFPERLGKLLLIHVPSIFMTAWKVIYPFIDNKTKKKNVQEYNIMVGAAKVALHPVPPYC
ncbi:hypothetical protein Droror1_Dr00018392 [Drosera rotundifolia]